MRGAGDKQGMGARLRALAFIALLAATPVRPQPADPAGSIVLTGTQAAYSIAKALTAAYLSTEGHAFGTRTASQIVQEHFNPGEALAPAGPLFGVQFSQLPCSDLSARFAGGAADAGPKRSPLGLSADPGGLPLYKGGTPVGGPHMLRIVG